MGELVEPDFQIEDSLINAIFNEVDLKFQEALRLREATDLYKHILFERDPMTLQPVARFGIAENYDLFAQGQGEACELTVPLDPEADRLNPRAIIGIDNSNRYFTASQTIGKRALALKVTNFKIDEYGDFIPVVADTVDPYMRRMDLWLKIFNAQIIPLRKTRQAS